MLVWGTALAFGSTLIPWADLFGSFSPELATPQLDACSLARGQLCNWQRSCFIFLAHSVTTRSLQCNMDRVNQLAFILVALTLQKFYCVRKHTLIRANRLPISRGSNKTEAAALGLSILLCACFCSYRGHLIPSHSAHIYLVYCGIIF